MTEPEPSDLLERARAGDQEALGQLIGAHRGLLDRIARDQIQGRLQARLSVSDVVQQTCLSAIRHFDDFRGSDEPQFVAWLKGVHKRNVADVVRRHVVARKRAVGAQEPLPGELPQEGTERTASQHAVLNESVAQIVQALDALPEAQACAVRLRFLEGLTLASIAQEMNRTEVAVASLLKRGLAALRQHLPRDLSES